MSRWSVLSDAVGNRLCHVPSVKLGRQFTAVTARQKIDEENYEKENDLAYETSYYIDSAE